MNKRSSKLLFFVSKNNPILRERIPEENNFKDPTLQEVIEDMCYLIWKPV